jgi:CheY-like chemotaxis protein
MLSETNNRLPKGTEPAPKSILIVDDDQDIIAFLTLALQELTPYLPLKVYTGLEAVETADVLLFDLLILDYRIPYINGIQVYDIICDILQKPAIPTIFISADTQVPLEEISKRQMVFMPKPLNLNTFLDTVETMLGAKT